MLYEAFDGASHAGLCSARCGIPLARMDSLMEIWTGRTLSLIGTEEPVTIQPDRHRLYLLVLLTYILYLLFQDMREAPPRSCFETWYSIFDYLTHEHIEARSAAIQ
jgi:hypothetical protein